MKVILRADCYVGKTLRKAGDTVDVAVGLESDFGEPAPPEFPDAPLGKLTKQQLLDLAAERGIEATADNNKDEIIAKLSAGD